MRHYAVFDQLTGEILRTIRCQEEVAGLHVKPGEQMLPTLGDVTDMTHWVQGSEVVAFTPEQAERRRARPPGPARWDNGSMDWVDLRSLEQARADKWAEMKRARDSAEWGGFATAYGRFDSDPESQTKLIGAAQMASLAKASGAEFSMDWTREDNEVVTLNADQMLAVGFALSAHINEVHQRGRSRRAAIEAATTLSQLKEMSW